MKKKKTWESANRKLLIATFLILFFVLTAGLIIKGTDNEKPEPYGKINENVEIAQKDDLKEKTRFKLPDIEKEIDGAKNAIQIKKGLASKWLKRTFGIDALDGAGSYFVDDSTSNSEKSKGNETNYGTFKVKRVIDGDTFIISNDKRIRMLGVDTPESVNPDKTKNTPFGKVASKYTKKRLKGQKVTLKYDAEKQDKYGRELCYVYLEDGTFYNKELVEKGYAKALIIEPNVLHETEILKAESKAKEARLGIWKEN